MNSSDLKVKINLVANADIKDVTSSVKTLREIFNSLKIPDKMMEGFTNSLDKAEKYAEKMNESLTKGFKTNSDVSNYEKNLNGFNSALETVIKNYQKLSNKDFAQSFSFIDQKELDEVNKTIDSLQNKISSFKSDKLNELNREIARMKEYTKAASLDNFKEGFKENDIRKMGDALIYLNKGYERVNQNTEEGKKKATVYKEVIGFLTKTFEDASKETGELGSKLNELKKAELTRDGLGNTQLEESKKTFISLGEAIENAKNKQQEYGMAAAESGKQSVALDKELAQMKSRITYFLV